MVLGLKLQGKLSMLKELTNKDDEASTLNNFLNRAVHTDVIIISNGNQCPVPSHLLDKWYKDLRDYQEKLVMELIYETE